MGYKLKRILIYPDGVTEKQVRPKYETFTVPSGDTKINLSGTPTKVVVEFNSTHASGYSDTNVSLNSGTTGTIYPRVGFYRGDGSNYNSSSTSVKLWYNLNGTATNTANAYNDGMGATGTFKTTVSFGNDGYYYYASDTLKLSSSNDTDKIATVFNNFGTLGYMYVRVVFNGSSAISGNATVTVYY